MAQLTETKDGVPAIKIDKHTDAPFQAGMFDKAARFFWRTCKTSVRMRLALDAEWNDTHPHVLTVADADRVMGVMQFDDATYAKQVYDTMDETFRWLERLTRRVALVRFWARQILSLAAVAAFVWLVLLWIG